MSKARKHIHFNTTESTISMGQSWFKISSEHHETTHFVDNNYRYFSIETTTGYRNHRKHCIASQIMGNACSHYVDRIVRTNTYVYTGGQPDEST